MALTGKYYYVDQGAVVDGPRDLPRAWKNISRLDKLSSDRLIALGWYPEDRVGFDPINGNTQRRVNTSNVVNVDHVLSTWVTENLTQVELDAKAGSRFDDFIDIVAFARALADVQQAKGGPLETADLSTLKQRFIVRYKALL